MTISLSPGQLYSRQCMWHGCNVSTIDLYCTEHLFYMMPDLLPYSSLDDIHSVLSPIHRPYSHMLWGPPIIHDVLSPIHRAPSHMLWSSPLIDIPEEIDTNVHLNQFDICLTIQINDVCSICLEAFQINSIVSKLTCNHYFHKTCIKEWIKEKPSCPLDRKPIKNINR